MAYQPQGENADEVHKDVAAVAKNGSVQRHEWLRGAEAHQRLRIGLEGKVSISLWRNRDDRNEPRRIGTG